MDAKITEAEQWMRQQIDEAFRIPEEEWGCESAPDVVLDPHGARALIAELDRLRKFERDVMALREDPNAGSLLWIAKVIATMNGNYRCNESATGGEGT